jgi:hypothetical protein
MDDLFLRVTVADRGFISKHCLVDVTIVVAAAVTRMPEWKSTMDAVGKNL